MKTLAISLQRSKERRSYITQHLAEGDIDFEIIDAIDGAKLTEHEVELYCDVQKVKELGWWLTPGAIGCALSHLKAYRILVKNDLPYAFIVEDDVILPSNIKQILENIANNLKQSEIILLYYASFGDCKLSSIGSEEISNQKLCYPMNIEQTITASAYIITNEAARNMIDSILPISVTADSWHYFYRKNAFSSFRCLFPLAIKTKHFKSSIDYIPADSLKAKIAILIDRYKIPPAFQLLKLIRKHRANRMNKRFTLTQESSPIYQALISKKN
ncbi:MAG: glycosyltransferase family 25 protein [Elusimicrobiota bacterium]